MENTSLAMRFYEEYAYIPKMPKAENYPILWAFPNEREARPIKQAPGEEGVGFAFSDGSELWQCNGLPFVLTTDKEVLV